MSRRPRWLRLLVVLGVVALVAAISSPASGGSIQVGDPRLQGDPQAVVDRDARTERKAPSAQQRAAARGKTVRWNRFGTPQVLSGDGDYLATGLASDPVAAARAWLAGNTTLLGIDGSAVADLELLASAPIGKGRAVLFRQRFGGLPAGHDGLVVVGVVAGKVAYVSSSLAGGDLAGAASLSPTEAFRRAAASAGRSVGAVTRLGEADGWTICGPTASRARNASGWSPCRSPAPVRCPRTRRSSWTARPLSRWGSASSSTPEAAPSCSRRAWSTTRASRPGRSFLRRRPSTTPRPTRASSGAGRPGPAVTGSSRAARPVRSGTSTPARGRPSRPMGTTPRVFTTGSATTRSRSGPRRPRRVPTATTSTGGRTSGSSSGATLTRRSPRPRGTTSTPRGRTCSPGTTACTTGPTISASRRTTFNLQQDNFGLGGLGQRPRAGQRPGRRRLGRSSLGLRGAGQRQPDHPAGRAWRRSRTCTCGSRSPGPSTPLASTATSTCP